VFDDPNPEQQAAVRHGEGPLLIVAGGRELQDDDVGVARR
jgi:hypothetical protein